MARAQSVGQLFKIAQQNTLAATRARIVETAKEAHKAVMDTDPRPVSFTRRVDGVLGAPEEDVKADGVIVYDYPRLPLVVAYALEMLEQFSPVLTGEYRKSHTIFLNDEAVEDLSAWKQGDTVAISNPMPYARKIEVGTMTMRVPGTDQVYEQAVSATNKRYGNIAKALFTYRGIVGPDAKASAKNKSENRFPAIVFQVS